MANSDHLAKLRRGVESWNLWKGTDGFLIKPDLSNADLSGAYLEQAVLSDADLSGANLSNARLDKAHLSNAKLINANLSGARLPRSDLVHADLTRADLSGAYLEQAVLSGATFDEANLRRASLIDADLRSANLSNANLTEVNLGHANLTSAVLVHANLSRCHLGRATFLWANLSQAVLSGSLAENAELRSADLCGARLIGTNLSESDLSNAKLRQADLSGATLIRANLNKTDLSDAVLTGANLSQAILVRTKLSRADLTGCFVYGLSAWDVELDEANQSNLIITPDDDAPKITVDNLEVASFIYLLLKNEQIRHVIDTITSKVVLILGRFTPERKAVLDALREELRRRDYLPVLFDFDKPSNRDITETVSTLAHMARFVIADITDAKSIPQELMRIVPALPSVPIQPLLLASQREYGMFEHFKRFPWVLEPYLYEDQDRLLASLTDKVIGPAEKKAKEQTRR